PTRAQPSEGFALFAHTSRAARHRDASGIEHHHYSFALHKFETDVELVADSIRTRRRTVQAEMWNAAFETSPKLRLEFRRVLHTCFPLLRSIFGCYPGAHNGSHIFGSGPAPKIGRASCRERVWIAV